nr:NaD1 T20K precursor [synthetic construct]
MARSLCFMAFAILAMMLFVAYEVQAGLPVCGETCVGGTCNTPGCKCSWPVCTRNGLVFDEKMTKTGAEILAEEAKTLAAALLEEEIMDN